MSIKTSLNAGNGNRSFDYLGFYKDKMHSYENINDDKPEIELKNIGQVENNYKYEPKLRSLSEPQAYLSRQSIKQNNQFRLQQLRERMQDKQNEEFVKQYSQHISNTQLYRYRILKDIKQKLDDNNIEYDEINQTLEQIQSLPIPNAEKMFYLNEIENMLYMYEQKTNDYSNKQQIVDNIIPDNDQRYQEQIPVDLYVQSNNTNSYNNINPQKTQILNSFSQSQPKQRVSFKLSNQSKQTLPNTFSSQLGFQRSQHDEISSDYEDIMQHDVQNEARVPISNISTQRSADKADVLSQYSQLMDASISAQNNKNNKYMLHNKLQNDLISQLHIYKTDQQGKQPKTQGFMIDQYIDDKLEHLEQIDENLNNSLKKNAERQNQIDRILNSLQIQKQNISKRKNNDGKSQNIVNKPELQLFKQKETISKTSKQISEQTQPMKEYVIQRSNTKEKQAQPQTEAKLQQNIQYMFEDKQTQTIVEYQNKQTQCFIPKQQLFEPRKLDTIEECVQTETNANLLSSNIQQPKQLQSNLFMSQLSNQPLQNSLFTQPIYEESLSSLMKEEQTKLEQQSLNEQISKSVIQQQTQQLQQKKLKDQINAELKMQELRENFNEQSFITKQEEDKTAKLQQFQNQMLLSKQNAKQNSQFVNQKVLQTTKNMRNSQLSKASPSLLSVDKKALPKSTSPQPNNIISATKQIVNQKKQQLTQYAIPSKQFQQKTISSKRQTPTIQSKASTVSQQAKSQLQSSQRSQNTYQSTTKQQVINQPIKQTAKSQSRILENSTQKNLQQSKQQRAVSSVSNDRIEANLELIKSEFNGSSKYMGYSKVKQIDSLMGASIPAVMSSPRKNNVFTRLPDQPTQAFRSYQHNLSPRQLQNTVPTPQDAVKMPQNAYSPKKRVATLVFD